MSHIKWTVDYELYQARGWERQIERNGDEKCKNLSLCLALSLSLCFYQCIPKSVNANVCSLYFTLETQKFCLDVHYHTHNHLAHILPKWVCVCVHITKIIIFCNMHSLLQVILIMCAWTQTQTQIKTFSGDQGPQRVMAGSWMKLSESYIYFLMSCKGWNYFKLLIKIRLDNVKKWGNQKGSINYCCPIFDQLWDSLY